VTGNLKEKIGILEVSSLMRWVRSVVGEHYTVRFEEDAETAYVDYGSKLIVIPQPNASMTLRDAIRLRGFCIHETSHPMYQPKCGEVMRANPTRQDSPLGGIYNLVLDVHAESRRAMDFPGDMKALSEFGAVTGHDCHDRLKKALKDNGNVWPKGFEKIASVLTACRNAEATWNMGMFVGFKKLVDDLYPQEVRDKAAELETKFELTRRLVDEGEKETEYTLWDLAKEIFEYLYEKDPQSEILPKDGKGKPIDKGEDGDEECESESGDGEGDDDSQSDADADEAELSKEDGKEGKGKLTKKIKVTELLLSNHYEAMHPTGDGHGVGFDYTNHRMHRQYTPVDPATFKITNYGAKR
jgi:hypothetical protein